MPNSMQEKVREFHKKFGHDAPEKPTILSREQIILRTKLIREELTELEEALWDQDLTEAYDACLDILYVTFGTLVAMGLESEEGFSEVHESNMSKLGSDGKPLLSRGEDIDCAPLGKVIKGPNYFAPNLHDIVKRQIKDSENNLERIF